MQRALSTVVLLGLLLASAAAFVITEHLKLVKSPIYKTYVTTVFSPVCGCATNHADIRFRSRSNELVTVTILDGNGNTVDTVAPARVAPKGAKVTFIWTGRTSDGSVAPDGVYKPRVELSSTGKTILMPNRITLDTTPPKVLTANAGAGVLVLGSKRPVRIDYTLNEHARAVLLLSGKQILLGRHIRMNAHVNWNGKVGGTPLPPGRYVLDVAARDAAGNLTPPTQQKHVAVQIEASKK